MDPRRLLLFRSVARSGSLSAAARELATTQPAVSQQLRLLEREAGLPLVLRGPRGVALTEAGERLLTQADAIAAHLHLADEELADLAQLRAGRVRLVAFPSAAATLVPDALDALTRDHPGVSVEMVEAEPPEAAAAVRQGEADVAVLFGYPDHAGPGLQAPDDAADLAWVPLGDEPVSLVVDDGASTTLDDLRSQTWIAGCPRCRGHLVDSCRRAGFEPRIRFESDDYVVVQNLVARGLGVTALPRLALQAFRHPGVAVRASALFGRRTVGAVHRAGAEQVPSIRALLERLQRAAAHLPD
ncbi:LysR family transcriptional regulator [Micropruina glycogenica]|uniref:LysR family transcriptional regulator n=1 Tax=Micropruina glycogenica TaxID=75385 RepID=A0A2N9JHM0_9ACTN|nr:LysR family transcriptional regulator [Micropruina glycogenica]SPD86899.1 LysR family transcriptional regulator [Micropruina glycogenica]